MLEVWQLPTADLLHHCLGRALAHVRVCRDGRLAGIVDVAGVNMAQVVLSRNLLQEALLVPLHKHEYEQHRQVVDALVKLASIQRWCCQKQHPF